MGAGKSFQKCPGFFYETLNGTFPRQPARSWAGTGGTHTAQARTAWSLEQPWEAAWDKPAPSLHPSAGPVDAGLEVPTSWPAALALATLTGCSLTWNFQA